ncbi:bifunctional nicotinamidase/pyrazinamidase [Hymenobacter sp. BT770]|uniref:bifunctional nicotinamidase/pyrazinamidase n=1 Tax=Hymenobacter sp. BT770 TaxID=2886942 RepID=UPI001D11D003|nr:bifunctional nicotinamidase/pyrazinamidase [Hymenobacter sp. BT770]MCC3155317.1 bifunctional nicotinamidase/pyrazinamidase [Hymenobacter sp. BT770]MDO3417314.1 bifunctional nicotinamidase/pyrazinamidase [Hymenobacter sp. BT770]
MKTLLLIDIQNDFVPGGRLAVPDGDAIIPLVNALQPHFDLVVASQDWHPAGHESFASSHAGHEPFNQIELHGLPQTLWPDHCVQETAGTNLHPALDTRRVEAIFRKGMAPEIDSYSAFYDNGRRKSTGLAEYLRGRSATDVYLVGLAGDFCVYFSALDAQVEGFATHFITDATRPISTEGFQTALADMQARGIRLLESQSLLAPKLQ